MNRADNLFQDVGPEKRRIPVTAIVIALLFLAAVVLGLAYFSIAPLGSEVDLSDDVSNALRTHFAKKEKRNVEQISLYECNEFTDSLTSRTKNYAAIVELSTFRLGADANRPDPIPDGEKGFFVAAMDKTRASDWGIKSIYISQGDYASARRPKTEADNPCNLAKKAKD